MLPRKTWNRNETNSEFDHPVKPGTLFSLYPLLDCHLSFAGSTANELERKNYRKVEIDKAALG